MAMLHFENASVCYNLEYHSLKNQYDIDYQSFTILLNV